MNFNHPPSFITSEEKKSIAAIVTPLGEGGVAIVRISGKEAIAIASKVFSKEVAHFTTHTAHLGYVRNELGRKIDQALCLVMRAPASYTGEDVVEFQCHGGTFSVRKVLEAVLRAGALLAAPGEFTYRAFLHGKIDLAQAESVQRLICAKSDLAYAHAQNHLEGRLSHKVANFQKELVEIAAILEAWVDFPEEDLAFASFTTLIDRLALVGKELMTLLETYDEGKRLEQGAKIALIGAPNVGKSSLMNALLEASRAIVTAIPGTTRDTVEAEFILGGRSLTLVDTAGLRETSCAIEQMGIERSRNLIAEADLLLWVIDATQPQELLPPSISRERCLVVVNKVDAVDKIDIESDGVVSALKNIGIEELRKKIEQKLSSLYTSSKDDIIIASHRHHEALLEAKEGVERVLSGLNNGLSAEFLTFDLKAALRALGRVIGQDVTEEILSSIFSQFCIGK
jgi:tRNA modification GTPase